MFHFLWSISPSVSGTVKWQREMHVLDTRSLKNTKMRGKSWFNLILTQKSLIFLPKNSQIPNSLLEPNNYECDERRQRRRRKKTRYRKFWKTYLSLNSLMAGSLELVSQEIIFFLFLFPHINQMIETSQCVVTFLTHLHQWPTVHTSSIVWVPKSKLVSWLWMSSWVLRCQFCA